ncbi:GAF domain-like protein [Catenaria anguillulae PL171]|uniref:GAF domain-like protein n=1 Tax=Catenaria anguillulae PL171 TaxID=765915 RepID=A0A1Y2HN01_9FUNG|nr:GAF domain-like protein [Catenaria anguillulae PL171]
MKTLPPSTTDDLSKAALYATLIDQTAALIEDQRNWITNTANVSALIYHALRDRQVALGQRASVNWVGVYVRDHAHRGAVPKLILGPFQGKIACTEIPFTKGVCGKAARDAQTQLVADVHAFPGHIACDSLTNSEVVVPIVLDNGYVIGVLDLDCEVENGFDEDDVRGLEAIVKLLVAGCDWPLPQTLPAPAPSSGKSGIEIASIAAPVRV